MLPTAANPVSPDSEDRDPWGSVEHVFTKSPRTVNTLRFFSESETYTSGEPGQPDYAGKLGLHGSVGQTIALCGLPNAADRSAHRRRRRKAIARATSGRNTGWSLCH